MLERGEVANTWKTERWDSLRLLTPNWLTRLPGLAYDGEDPDGFMAVPELIEFLERYAEHVDAPVRTQTDRHVGVAPRRRRLPSSRPTPGRWEADAVVVASGAFNAPRRCRRSRRRCRPRSTRSPRSTTSAPTSCGAGRVLVVGASATGLQLADELLRSGREVTDRRRRARPHAADLPGPRHHVVARPDRPARRALRRGRRPRARAARPLAAARRHARARGPRPQRPHATAAPRSSGAWAR